MTGERGGDAVANKVLGALDSDDLAAVKPFLTRRSVVVGEVLLERGEFVSALHFPVTATLSNLMVLRAATVETAMIGREGVSGLAAFLAGTPCSWRVIVQQGGAMDVLPVEVMRARLSQSPDLMRLMLRLTHDYQSQAAQAAACNATHEVVQRVARWILMASDRSGAARLTITQEQLAMMVGSQRTTVNEGLARLKDVGAVRQRRGAIEIENRQGLETHACECYAADLQRSHAWAITP